MKHVWYKNREWECKNMEIEATPNWLCKQKTISTMTTFDTLDIHFRQYADFFLFWFIKLKYKLVLC